MFDPAKLSENRLFQALTELKSVDRQGILTVDVTPIFVRNVSGETYGRIEAELRELGIIRATSAVPPAGETGWIVLDGEVLLEVTGNKFKPYDRVAIAFVLSMDHELQVTEATWLNTAAFP